MYHSKQYIILVALTVANGGFLHGFDVKGTMIFPGELSRLGTAGTFLGGGLRALAALWFLLICIPETKGKSRAEREGIFAHK